MTDSSPIPAMNQLSISHSEPRTILDLPEEVIGEICEWLDPQPEDLPEWEFDGHICCSTAGEPRMDRPEGAERIHKRRHRLEFGSCCKLLREYVLRSTLNFLRFYLCGRDLMSIGLLSEEARNATCAITLFRDDRQHSDHKRSFTIPDLIRPFRNLTDLEITWFIFGASDPRLADFIAASEKAAGKNKASPGKEPEPLLSKLSIQMTAADKIFDSENALKVHQLCYLLQPITTTRLRTFELKLGDMNGLHRSAVPWRSLTESIATIIFPTLERLDIKIEIDLDGPPFRMDISNQVERLLCAFRGSPALREIKILLDLIDDPQRETSIWRRDFEHDTTLCETVLPTTPRLMAMLGTLKDAYPELKHFALDLDYRIGFSTSPYKLWAFEYPVIAAPTIGLQANEKPPREQTVEAFFVGDDIDARLTIHRQEIRQIYRERR